MKLWSLVGQRCLIVDDFPEMRSMLRNLLTSFSAQDLQQARNGEEAMRALAQQHYDIIFCDYNLGSGRDGQQILEEAKQRGLLALTSIFIMVTAENTSAMVMGAIEYQPDDYLAKPFTKAVLQARLTKLMEKKAALADVYRAVEKQDVERLEQLGAEQAASHGKHRHEVWRLQTELLLSVGSLDAAEDLCATVLADREVPWALLATARARYQRGDYGKAQHVLRRLIEVNPTHMAAYDWLAKVQDRLGESAAAQSTLAKAVARSPKSVLRQRSLAEIAARNGDAEVAERAYRQVIKVGEHSVWRRPADYTGLVQVLVDKNETAEALKVVGEIGRAFRDDAQAALQTLIAEADVHLAGGAERPARELVAQAVTMFEAEPALLAVEVGMSLAHCCAAVGLADAADEVLKHIVRNHHEDETLLAEVRGVYEAAGMQRRGGESIKAVQGEVAEINNQGVRLAQQGDVEQAARLFMQALEKMPNNAAVNLNAAQILMLSMSEHGATRATLEQTRRYLDAARDSPAHCEKQRKLSAMWRQLAAAAK